MVIQPISKSQKLQRKSSMETAPVKSQPLHNFSFPFLKWGKNQMNNHRWRKHVDSCRESPSLEHRSSASEAESDSVSQKEQECKNQKDRLGSGCRSSRNRSSSATLIAKPEKDRTESETVIEEVRSNLLIRFRTGGKDESESKKKRISVVVKAERDEVEESVQKPWNLRPRRAIIKARDEFQVVGASKNGELQEKLENQPKSLRLRGFAEAQNVEKKEKQKFSISLSREEVEEDFFALTGSKPPRRPNKRAKNIQRQVDNVLPGSWLAGITADSYTIPDVHPKR